ncbi:MAG: universal stress protein [Alicyclobacillus sp.]|nr:universal stress protein [Alicyclobacillus sp.]
MRKFIYATDGSDSAKKAGEMAGRLLDAFPEAELLVVHVIRPVFVGDALGFADSSGYDLGEDAAKRIEQEVRQLFSRWEGRVRFRATTGSPAIAISEVADAEHADLIIMGSHGRGAVDRLLLGSVSHGVLNRAHVPVLVVR